MVKKNINLESIDETDLLNVRMSDLPLQIHNTWLQECVEQLYQELKERNIDFRPQCYLADEWLTPEKETCIGIPFYLAHPRLIQLENKFMIDAEGEGKQWCMKLLRHETGHALCYAYGFHKRKKWQRIFGPSDQAYTDTYKYRPYSKNYVRHLDGYYAQYHPEEDFVETFAVWMTPNINWEEKYAGWNALKKIRYVDQLMQEVRVKNPKGTSRVKYWRLSTLRMTLNNHYKKKRKYWAEEFPDFHDPFLNRIFAENAEGKGNSKASRIISKYRRTFINHIARFSGEKKYVINDLLKDISKRCHERQLVVQEDENTVCIKMTSYITALIMNYQYTGKFRPEKKRKK